MREFGVDPTFDAANKLGQLRILFGQPLHRQIHMLRIENSGNTSHEAHSMARFSFPDIAAGAKIVPSSSTATERIHFGIRCRPDCPECA
jgi:hypothetical protein